MFHSGNGLGQQASRDDVVQFGSSRPRRRRWPRWLPLLLPVAGAAIVVAAIAGAAGGAGGGHPRRPSAVTVTEVGHPLLGVHSGWELFGRGPSGVVRIELARGRITRTAVPGLQSTGPVAFLAGPAQAIIRPLDVVPGYLVPDGRRARPLRALLSQGGVALPGPRAGQLWVQGAGRPAAPVELVGPGGTPLGLSLRVPTGGPWFMTPDGSGYPLLGDAHGTYDARPGGLRWVTSGTVAAVGPTRWLTTECRRPDHCSTAVVDSATGARSVLSRSRDASTYLPGGVVSPDGSTAAVFRVSGAGRVTLHLIDLASGADHPVAVSDDQESFETGTAAWSPDGRWLFVADHGKLLAVAARTRRVRGLGIALPAIAQVAIVSGPGSLEIGVPANVGAGL